MGRKNKDRRRRRQAEVISPEPTPAIADSVPVPAPTADTPGEWVSSYEKLAEIFGCHHKSFARWKRNHSDAPEPRQNGEHSVSAWREFFAAHVDVDIERMDQERHAYENRIKAAKAIQEEAKAKECDGIFVKKEDVIESVRRLDARISPLLRQKLLNEAPADTAGKSMDERREYFGKIYDEVMLGVKAFADEWLC